METTKYIVYSNGQLISNFGLEQVIKNLAKNFSLTREEISHFFVDDTPKKIKTLETKIKAERLRVKLSKLGLDSQISEVVDTSSHYKELEIPPRVELEFSANHYQKRSYKMHLIIAMLLVAILVGAYFALK